MSDAPIVDIVETAPTNGKGPITEQQRNALANMAVSGLPLEVMAQAVGRSKASVTRILNEDPKVQTQIEVVRGQVMKTVALHHMDMMSKLGRARERIDEGLNSQDVRIALDTSKWLVEHVIPKSAQRVEVEFSGETKHTVQTAALNISAQMGELKTALSGTTANFQNSIKQELPGPISMESAREDISVTIEETSQ